MDLIGDGAVNRKIGEDLHDAHVLGASRRFRHAGLPDGKGAIRRGQRRRLLIGENPGEFRACGLIGRQGFVDACEPKIFQRESGGGCVFGVHFALFLAIVAPEAIRLARVKGGRTSMKNSPARPIFSVSGSKEVQQSKKKPIIRLLR